MGVLLTCFSLLEPPLEDGTFKADRETMIDGGIKYLNERFGNNKECEKSEEATGISDNFLASWNCSSEFWQWRFECVGYH